MVVPQQSSRSARPTSADKLHSAGFIGSPLRMPLRDSPGLVLCALFTLRFEAPYILPWVAHHRRLGVDRLLLYHDDASGMWSPSLSERHSELLSAPL